MKALEKIKADPRVKEAWSEQGTDDGYWVTLKEGYADYDFDPHQRTHTIHEGTIKAIKSRMLGVRPCSCSECLHS